MLRTFRYPLRVTRCQSAKLNALLALLTEIYNAALQERVEAWKRERKAISYYEQTKELTELRAAGPEYQQYAVEILREPLRRVNHAFRVSMEHPSQVWTGSWTPIP